MKVLYIYRNKSLGFSIANVFRPIEEEMHKYAEVDRVYLPEAGAGIRQLWKNIRAACNAADAKEYDIVHITGGEHYLTPYLSRKHKVVVTVHDLGFFTNFRLSPRTMMLYMGWIRTLKLAHKVVCISSNTQSEVQKYLQLPENKICTIHNPVSELYSYKEKKINVECPVLLHIGTKPNKNLSNTILAIRNFPCELRIIGKLADKDKLLLEENKINYSYTFNLTNEEIAKEYENCDIVSFPSLYEGFGMPIIEGQASGRVVVTSNLSPMKDIAGNAAVLVDPSDYNSIIEGYRTAINKYTDYVAAGLKNVQKFSVEEISRKYYSLYKDICE